MGTKVRQKGVRRNSVPKEVRKVWDKVKKKMGSELMVARLLVDESIGTTTARNAIDLGIATSEVESKITAWCNKEMEAA